MKMIFYLTGDHAEFAKEEVLALTNSKDSEWFGRILIADSDDDFSDRLAFTHSTYRLLFVTNASKLKSDIDLFDWLSEYDENVCVRVIHLSGSKHIDFSEQEIAYSVGGALKKLFVNRTNKGVKNNLKLSVNLTNPKTVFTFFVAKEGIFVGKKLSDIDKTFFERWPHKRPCFHPTSITSKLARACVNLSGIKKGTVYDPFCGVGAVLLEAGMMGMKCIGSDLFGSKLEMARKNMDHYGIKGELIKRDALSLPKNKFECIVTDPPYGRNEKVTGTLDSFYAKFMHSAYDSLKKDGVMVMLAPDSVDIEKMNPGFVMKTRIKWFVHHSLTRQIIVFEKR